MWHVGYGCLNQRNVTDMSIEKFEGDLSKTTGQILASWFLTNPNGPTAYAIGIIEIRDKRHLFYRWMHFTGGNTWLLNPLNDEHSMWGPDYGDILMNSLLLANNYFLAHGGEKNFLSSIPQIVFTNGNPSVIAAFNELLQISLLDQDWGKEIYYVEKYGYHLFDRYEEQFRDILETLKVRPDTSKEMLDFYWKQHAGKKGFDNWEPNRYVSQMLTPMIYQRWLEITNQTNFTTHALYEFAQMWAGSHQVAKWSGLAEKLGDNIKSLQSCLDFFEEFNLPLLPKEYDEAFIRKKMRLD